MPRHLLFALLTAVVLPSFAAADEYLLRLETLGTIDAPEAAEEPEETVLRSIEVVVRPGSRFHGKVILGKETLSLTGKMRAAEQGKFAIELSSIFAVDKGDTIPAADGTRKPLPQVTKMMSSVVLAVGDSLPLGGVSSKQEIRHGKALRSHERNVLTLTQLSPDME